MRHEITPVLEQHGLKRVDPWGVGVVESVAVDGGERSAHDPVGLGLVGRAECLFGLRPSPGVQDVRPAGVVIAERPRVRGDSGAQPLCGRVSLPASARSFTYNCMDRLVSFLAELRRRRVYQVAVVHAAAAFVGVQAADLFLPRLGLPDRTVTAVVVLTVVGFPVALILGWVFDVTPSGVKRSVPASEAAHAAVESPGKWRVAGGTTAAVTVLIGGGWWLSSLALGPTPPIQALAVLPFENLTGDPAQEYFVDGMHDALITELSQFGALHVISRTSVRRYRGTAEPLERIGRELGVGGLIEAAVTRDSDRVRVSVRLIHAPSERHLWARTYERDMGGILAMHGEISRAIAREVRIALAPGEETEIHSVDPDAYDAYLRGRFHWHQLGGAEWERSIAYFQEAIARDPDWALPWAGLSDTYHRLGDSRLQPGAVAYPLAREAALAALDRDPEASEAHLSLAAVKYHWDWDWDGADASYRRAIRLNPSNSYALRWYSLFLRAMGRHDEAIEHAEKAFLVDPLHSLAQTGVPLTLSIAGRHEEAAQRLERLLQREPGHPVARRVDLAAAHLALGEVERTLRGVGGRNPRPGRVNP